MSASPSRHTPSFIEERFRNEKTSSLFSYWLSLNDGHMPCYDLWDPIKIHQSMPWCSIIERGGETGFQIRFAGTALCDFYGEEMTGQAVGHRMDDEAREFHFSNIEEILSRPCATFMMIQARSDTGRDCVFECLSLPISDATGKGIRIINHQVIVEELKYGEAKSRFSLPNSFFWIDVGAGTPEV